jgi:hypothetical protein
MLFRVQLIRTQIAEIIVEVPEGYTTDAPYIGRALQDPAALADGATFGEPRYSIGTFNVAVSEGEPVATVDMRTYWRRAANEPKPERKQQSPFDPYNYR